MHIIPLAIEARRYVDAITQPPTPSRPSPEPDFTAIGDAVPRLVPRRGEVVVISGSVPTVRMATAALALTFGRVVVDAATYAGPGLGDFLQTLAGVGAQDVDDVGRLLGAAEALAAMDIGMVRGEDLVTEVPADALLVVEAHRYAGGLRALANAAKVAKTPALVPHDEVDGEVPGGAWRAVRLRSDRAGTYASGRRHVLASAATWPGELRLAFDGRSGRFL